VRGAIGHRVEAHKRAKVQNSEEYNKTQKGTFEWTT